MVAAVFEAEIVSARHDEGVVGIVVGVAVAAPVEDHGVVEEGAILFFGVLQSL